MVIRWHDRILEIDESQFGLKPADPKVTDGAVRLAARGRFDTSSGELALTPPEGAKPEPIALASEGLKVTGLGKSDAVMKVDGGLVGDLAALDRTLAVWKLAERMNLAGGVTARISAQRGVGGRMDFDAKLESPDISLPSSDGVEASQRRADRARRARARISPTRRGWTWPVSPSPALTGRSTPRAPCKSWEAGDWPTSGATWPPTGRRSTRSWPRRSSRRPASRVNPAPSTCAGRCREAPRRPS